MAPRAGPSGPYRRLRGVDQMYLAVETRSTPMHFGALVVLDGRALLDADGRLCLQAIRERLAERVAGVPELRRVVHRPGPLAGGPLWIEDPDFRIERHVGEAVLPETGDEDALLRFVETLMAPPLDRAHPLWRTWFVTGLPDGRVALLFIVHHALADGLGAMRLARALLADGPMPEARPAAGERAPAWGALVRDNARGLVAGARQLARPSTWRAATEVLRAFRAGWAATRSEPPTTLNAAVGPRRRTVVLRLDQRTARRVARAHDGGVNDLVLALASGGVRALLAARGEPVDRTTAVRAGIAVTLPPSARGPDAGNHFGSYVVSLPIREPDPPARLRLVSAERARAKRAQTITGVTAVRVWTTRFPPTRAMMVRQRYVNVMETFLPGPPAPIELLGAPVLDLIPIQPLGRNVGLTFLASTYAGCLSLTVRVDADGFPDLDVLMTAMERDWRTLAATVTATPDRRGTTPVTPR
jgi:WS/DGAT/MGAT family acyltransferase